MRVKLLDTTNELAKCIIGKECNLSYSLTADFTFNPDGLGFDYRKGSWRTSLIKNLSIEEISLRCFDITIDTENSKYIFRYGQFSDTKPLSKDEKMAIAMMTMF